MLQSLHCFRKEFGSFICFELLFWQSDHFRNGVALSLNFEFRICFVFLRLEFMVKVQSIRCKCLQDFFVGEVLLS